MIEKVTFVGREKLNILPTRQKRKPTKKKKEKGNFQKSQTNFNQRHITSYFFAVGKKEDFLVGELWFGMNHCKN